MGTPVFIPSLVGATFSQAQHTTAGVEKTYAVNFLTSFLLITLLFNKSYFSPSARIISISAQAIYGTPVLDPKDLNSTTLLDKYREGDHIPFRAMMELYAKSKAMQVVFTMELQKRLAETEKWRDVVVQACHPGLSLHACPYLVYKSPLVGAVDSTIWTREAGIASYPTALKVVRKVLGVISISSERGAVTPVFLATSHEAARPEVRGKYWDRCRWKWTPVWMEDGELRKKLWEQWEENSRAKLMI